MLYTRKQCGCSCMKNGKRAWERSHLRTHGQLLCKAAMHVGPTFSNTPPQFAASGHATAWCCLWFCCCFHVWATMTFFFFPKEALGVEEKQESGKMAVSVTGDGWAVDTVQPWWVLQRSICLYNDCSHSGKKGGKREREIPWCSL